MSTRAIGQPLPQALEDSLGSGQSTETARAGIVITLPDGNMTSEAGGEVRVRLALTTRPRGPVLVLATTSDRSEGEPRGVALFVPHRWDRPQDIVIRGKNDDSMDGDRPYDIRLSVVSLTDRRYQELELAPVRLVNQDDDSARIVVSPRGPLVTHEQGGEAIVDISLGSRPTKPVDVSLTVSDGTEAMVVGPTTLTLQPETWNVPQPVTVRGVGDLLADGAVSYDLILTLYTEDPAYSALPPTRVTLQNEDRAAFSGIGVLPNGGNASAAFDVNGDGTVVVGHSSGASGREAVRWTPEAGLVSLGGDNSAAWGVDRSGRTIVGEAIRIHEGETLPNRQTAVLWLEGAGPTFFEIPDQLGPTTSIAYAVSGNGERVVGLGKQLGSSGTSGLFWQGGQFNVVGQSACLAASYDGSVYVGYVVPSRYGTPLPYAMRLGERLAYPEIFKPNEMPGCGLLGACEAQARDLSDDGTVVVGWASSTALDRTYAVKWETPSGPPTLLASDVDAQALSISADGRVIVGLQQFEQSAATRWIGTEARTVADILAEAGVRLTGWQLLSARGVSQDGRVIVGEGVNPEGYAEGWIAILPADPPSPPGKEL